ncbi:hypothetical protein ATANTOWER_019200 [Ataeniobius toweri]|uniref:Uncharacterized protein n=1 Tax=Ataeniobius toweri TaxID=208326 RepID=A0ABU7AQB2_9TELE|nr:hypothetical protein [Ataeniobius toweri]
MMSYIMSPDLALEYNLCGHHRKRSFRELRLFDLIYGALKTNILTKDINKKDAERALSKWFTGARDRGGKRALQTKRELSKRGETLALQSQHKHKSNTDSASKSFITQRIQPITCSRFNIQTVTWYG